MTSETSVTRLYAQLREMAASFAFKPEERINETKLSKQLSASRTPLREAMNRLVAEGLLEFQSGKGFFSRALHPNDIFNLYETRRAIECAALKLGITRASDAQIRDLVIWFETIEPEYLNSDDPLVLLDLDEAFHVALCNLSGNDEMTRVLENLNARIRYIRRLDLAALIKNKADRGAHQRVLMEVVARNETAALSNLQGHIEMRRDEAAEAVRMAFAQLYVKG